MSELKKIHLEDQLSEHFRLNPKQKIALKKMGLETVWDLLHHFPTRYGEAGESKYIKDINEGELVTVYGRVKSVSIGKTFRGKVPQATASIVDETGQINAIWFHQPYIAKMLSTGALVKLEGRISKRKNSWWSTNPNISTIKKVPNKIGNSLFNNDKMEFLLPTYPERRGITSRWIHHSLKKIFRSTAIDELIDPVLPKILEKYHLPPLKTALHWIHLPKKENDALSARKRFAFQEVFFIQLQKQQERKKREIKESFVLAHSDSHIKEFTERFPFPLTKAQKRAIKEINKDLSTPGAMSRLLEGDVGSGKTAVAAASAYAVVTTRPENQDFGHLQVAYMAPTEILARQQFEDFIKHFSYLGIQIGFITSSGCQKFPSKVNPQEATKISKKQLLKWIENGEVPIVVGTHSLIQKTVKFKNLGLAVIDEQHRFGTIQRSNLIRKDSISPHLLSMTATPIPRTLALTIYGDLDLTLLDEMPKGRKEAITEIISPAKRKSSLEKIRIELKKGKQAFFICPRIDAPDPNKEGSLQAASVKEEVEYLEKDIFPEYRIAPLHGKMKPKEKEDTMKKFEKGEIDILVSTSVVEVGVNIPNATVIAIEGAERFGLSQLHQLRGRVLRSSDQAYCYIFSDTENKKSLERLQSLVKAKNGFELAEYDLAQRGAGELSGRRQWGVSDLAMEAIKNQKMVEAARESAREVIEDDPDLQKKEHSLLSKQISKKYLHFE